MTSTAGLWPTSTHYVVAVGDEVVLRAPRSIEGRLRLVEVLDKLPHLEVLAPAPIAAVDPVLDHLCLAHIPVWLLPLDLAQAWAKILDVRIGAAHTLARAMARMLDEPALRIWLERPPPAPDPRQLRLL